ncbi:MAG: hypothetical protein KGV59_05645 [Tenacibaculum sp.]|nr:hypothetical protein [Tenacibaculum sp.]
MKRYKYFVVIYIALGLVLSNICGITYESIGGEWLPKYWGNPIIYRKQGANSLEDYYSIYGLLANTVIWSVLLLLIDKLIEKMKLSQKILYKVLVFIFLVFSSYFLVVNCTFISEGFEEDLNYWHWDINKEAEKYNSKYKRSFY